MRMAVSIGVFAYIALQFAIGIWVSRRIRDEKDYVLGGRQLGVTLASFSVFATWFGAETVMGSSGRVYKDGLSGAQGEPFAYAVAILVMGFLFAVPLWRRGLITFGDFFRERFSPGVERLTVILLIPGSVLWAGAQVRGFGQVMSHTTGLDLWTAMSVAAAVVVAYTAFGGLLADVYTDFVQGIAIVAGLVAMLIAVAMQTGSPFAMLASVESVRLQPMAPDQSLLEFVEQWAIPICGSLVAVELISRILACRSPEVARQATPLGGIYYLLVALIPVYFGFIGPQIAPGLAEPEQLSLAIAQAYLPVILYIMFAGALISAVLSTVDSALLAAATLLSHNIILRLVPSLSEAAKVRAARMGVAGMGLVAYLLALRAEGIADLVETASAFATAGVFVAMVFGLFTGLGGAFSAYAALILGSLVWVAGQYVLELRAPYVAGLVAAALGYLTVAWAERFQEGWTAREK
jgi:solute:Na+ symporter, SSS family